LGQSPNDPRWTGVAALRVTCTPPDSPAPPPPNSASLGVLAFLPPVSLVVAALAALAVCL
jgi:hypothetical protein